jgi:hypothetical protein
VFGSFAVFGCEVTDEDTYLRGDFLVRAFEPENGYFVAFLVIDLG